MDMELTQLLNVTGIEGHIEDHQALIFSVKSLAETSVCTVLMIDTFIVLDNQQLWGLKFV